MVDEAQGPTVQPDDEDEGPEMAMNLPSAPAIASLVCPPAAEGPVMLPIGRSVSRQRDNTPEINFDHWMESALERSVPTARGMSAGWIWIRALTLIASIPDRRGPHTY